MRRVARVAGSAESRWRKEVANQPWSKQAEQTALGNGAAEPQNADILAYLCEGVRVLVLLLLWRAVARLLLLPPENSGEAAAGAARGASWESLHCSAGVFTLMFVRERSLVRASITARQVLQRNEQQDVFRTMNCAPLARLRFI